MSQGAGINLWENQDQLPKSDSEKFSYRLGVLIFVFVFYLLMAYLATPGFALLLSVGGLLSLGALKHFKAFLFPFFCLLAFLFWVCLRTPGIEWLSIIDRPAKAFDHSIARLLSQSILYPALILMAWSAKGYEAYRLTNILKYGIIVLSLILFIESIGGASIFQFIHDIIRDPIREDLAKVEILKSLYVLMLLFWPMIMALRLKGQETIMLLPLAVLVIAPFLVSANTVTLSLLMSTIVYLGAKNWPKNWVALELILAGAVFVLILIWPWAIENLLSIEFLKWGHTHLPPSWAERIHIWAVSAHKLFENPIWGQGFGFSRQFSVIPLHTHNVILQVGLELGVIGLILFASLWANFFMRLGEEGPLKRPQKIEFSDFISIDTKPYFLAQMTSFFVMGLMSFSLWQEWFLAMGAFSVVVALVTKISLEYEASSHMQLHFIEI